LPEKCPTKELNMLKFLVDEDLPRSTTHLLKEMGFVALDMRDCGLRGKSDEEIFEYAQKENAIILTGDRGIGSIVRFTPGTYYGIVVAHFPNELPVSELNTQIKKALNQLTEDDLKGNLLIIEPAKIRIRRHKEKKR
jgi:predicted nuclease of predicted toxin-antitoxin system